MLEIATFKLIDGGRGGIIIEGKESVKLSKNYQIIDSIKRTRKLILPEDIIDKVQQMKYFFLNCTGHWMTPFNNYYDLTTHKPKSLEYDPNGKIRSGQEILKNLWSRTEITGISYKSGGFVITGTVEAVEGKKTVINTPFIVEEDDLGFFSSAIEKLEDCVHAIIGYFAAKGLPEYSPDTILSEEEMKGLNMEELTNLMVEKLVDRNMIMLVKDEGDNVNNDHQKEIPEITGKAGKKDKLNTSKKNIDSENLPHAKEEETVDADEQIRKNLEANQRDAFNRPASDAEFPEEMQSKDKNISPKDLEVLEHSSNMGIETDNNEEKETWEE
jgi:hypothetical protein